MYLTEYQKVTIDNFMGLWDRGSLDDVPPDHASNIQNIAFARKREILTRPAASFSRRLPNGGNIVRQFDAAFHNNTLIPLVCDGVGNIWRLDNNTVLLGIPGLVDFDALNMNDHVYIAPMIQGVPFDPATWVVYVWQNPNAAIRPAAGFRPPAPISVTHVPGDNNVGPGYYGVAYSYIFDTGYVSPPSPVRVNLPNDPFPGGTSMLIQGLTTITSTPPNPPGVVGYIIFSTKGQPTPEDAARATLYEVQTVDDISSNSIEIDFFDTDLTIPASADPANGNLFNSMPRLPSGGGLGSVALIKYRGRMIIIGPNITYNPQSDPWLVPKPTDYTVTNDDRIFISHSGAPENFDVLTGYMPIQAEFDGNIPRTAFELFGVLYICKSVGTYATQDNGSEPLDATNPWILNLIDGGIGAYHHSVGTITGSQPSLSFNSTAFLANRNGLFIFNGNVLRPELSWKIRAIWQKMTIGLESQVRVSIDIYNDIFYVQMPIDDPILGPRVILAGDYSLGLDSNNIRWSVYRFPWPVFDSIMAAWHDPTTPTHGRDFYYLRLGTDGSIYKLDGFTTADEVWIDGQYAFSVAIDNFYQSAPLVVGDLGALNIFRFIRYRMTGSGILNTTLLDQGFYISETATPVVPDGYPGNYRDIGIQINFTNEKMIVKFGMDALTSYFRMSRFDVFGKMRWPTRPNG